MRRINNERGSALVLSLFAIFLISIITVPLLMSSQQGFVNSAKGLHQEQAHYAAESRAKIVKKALIEAVRQNGVSLTGSSIKDLVNDIENEEFTGIIGDLSLSVECSSGKCELVSQNTVGPTELRGKALLEIPFEWTTGTGGNEFFDLFGNFLITTTPSCTDSSSSISTCKFVNEDGKVPASETPVENYEQLFNAYLDTKFNDKPQLPNPLEPNTSSYDLNNTSCSITSSQGSSVLCLGDIQFDSDGDSTIVIDGDVISGGNIKFEGWGKHIIIKGNLIAEGELNVATDQQLEVQGNMISGGDMQFNQININVHGVISSMGYMDFPNDTKQLIANSLISQGRMSFTGVKDNITITDTIASHSYINFENDNKHVEITNGSIVAGDYIYISSKIYSMYVGGDISAQGYIHITNDIDHLEIGGTIYTEGYLEMNNPVNDLLIGGSIVARGEVMVHNDTNNFKINGSLLSAGKITFNNPVRKLNVVEFMASPGQIRFNNDINFYASNDDKISFGGISSPVDIFIQNRINNKTILLTDIPPADVVSGGTPTITFGK